MENINKDAQVLAFRLHQHHLADRLPPGSLVAAAGACGLQNTPPGSAYLSLHARISGLTPAEVDANLESDKELLQMWSLRAAPHLFPTCDLDVFTLGLLPDDEASLRAFIPGASQALDRIGISATEILRFTSEATLRALDNQEFTKDELGILLARQLEEKLTASQLAQWRLPSWYAAGQFLGESLVRFILSIVALQRIICLAPRRSGAAALIRTDQWLKRALPETDRNQARAELLRRYLGCFGPSTPAQFAAWTGISLAQATQTWRLVEKELTLVNFKGQETWIYTTDLTSLMTPPKPIGIRFLPPHDPYLQLRDRETLIPEKALQRQLWRSLGNPGVVLVNGRAAAMWRPRKSGARLELGIQFFTSSTLQDRAKIEAEALTLAPFRGCSSVVVKFS